MNREYNVRLPCHAGHVMGGDKTRWKWEKLLLKVEWCDLLMTRGSRRGVLDSSRVSSLERWASISELGVSGYSQCSLAVVSSGRQQQGSLHQAEHWEPGGQRGVLVPRNQSF